MQLRRLFLPADAIGTLPFVFAGDFRPIEHQNRLWGRLTNMGQKPKPWLGSECLFGHAVILPTGENNLAK